ncbi:MAG: DMT family transporter [Anaerolineae bacterium]|nr:DMT family transporter [Anaerolineae bacterium]
MTFGSDFAAVAFGLASAVTWGVGDFSGGLATRRNPVLSVVLISQTMGMLVLIALAIFRAEATPAVSDILWGAAAGVVGQVGLIAFYRAMAVGQVGVAAPVTAVLAAGIPVIFGAFVQGFPNAPHLVGFALALAGVWFLSRPQGVSGRPAGLGLAILGGFGFSGFLLLIAQVSDNAVFWPLVAARIASVSVMIIVSLARRQFDLPLRSSLPIILLAGVMDVGGNAFFVLSEQAGRLDVASVLSSLYPAVAVFLALLVLKERLTRIQAIGALLALIAIPLIAAR